MPQIQVSTTPLPYSPGIADPRMVQLAGGNILIAWQSNVNTGAGSPAGTDIIAQIISPLGALVGGEFRLNTLSTASSEKGVDIVALPNGGFMIAYEELTGNLKNLWVQEFDATGAGVSGLTSPVASGSNIGQDFDAQLTLAGDTSVFITYKFPANISGNVGRFYDTATNILSDPSLLSIGVPLDSVTLTNGTFVVLRHTGGYNSGRAEFDIVGTNGALLTSAIFDPTGTISPGDAAIVALAGGGFAIAVTNTFYVKIGLAVVPGGYVHTIRTFDAAGVQTGIGDFTTNGVGQSAEAPSLVALANGNFEFIYHDPQGTLFAVDFAPNAQIVSQGVFGSRPLLSANDMIEQTATVLADGRYMVAWIGGNSSSTSVRAQILDTRDAANFASGYTTPGQFGTAADDVIALAAASAFIASGPGNDSLTGGTAPSQLIGGAGDDIYILTAAGDVIFEAVGEGHDMISTALPHVDLASNVEDVVYTGSGSFIAGGNALDNRMTGGVGYDVLVGYGGNDTLIGSTGAANELIGGAGDDVYVSNSAGDTIVEYAGGGTDRIETELPIYVLRNEVENLTYLGAAGFLGIGNALGNTITGGTGRDDLYGRDGNDVINGGAGPANTLLGGMGDDVFIVAAIGDSVVEYAGEGTDRVETALSSFLMPGNIEDLVYTGASSFIGFGNDIGNRITGGAQSDTLYGYGGADRLIGGTGAADTLVGGKGDDVYAIGTTSGTSIVELAGEGVDTIETGLNTYTITADNVEILRFIGNDNFIGTGNALNNVIYGVNGNDTLYGLAGADLLFGNGGNDRLYGGSGAADTMFGGLGDDVYYVDAAGSSVIESIGEGNDRIETTTASFNLPENVESLVYIGSGNFTGTGSNGNESIRGGGMADNLSGGHGNDVLVGAAGVDILSGGAGVDLFRYNGGEIGIDQILDFTPGTDKIALALPTIDYAGFTRMASTALVQGAGANVATSAESTFIYDSTTGLLSYDADGSLVGGVIALAYLSPGLTLSLSDFVFV
jgi:Ca2+-binding RTX toxin-like protein